MRGMNDTFVFMLINWICSSKRTSGDCECPDIADLTPTECDHAMFWDVFNFSVSWQRRSTEFKWLFFYK